MIMFSILIGFSFDCQQAEMIIEFFKCCENQREEKLAS